MKQFEVIGLVPAQWSHAGIAIAVSRNGGTGVLDLEFCTDAERARQNFASLLAAGSGAVGLRFGPAQRQLADTLIALAAARPLTLICCGTADEALALRRAATASAATWLAEVSSLEAARRLDADFDALIARGHEGGGWVGQDSSSILLQKLIRARSAPAPIRAPIFVHGGIGIRAAAACRAAGAAGVILDDVLLLLAESALPVALQNELARLNGAECKPHGELLGRPCRVYARPGSAALAAAEQDLRLADGGTLGVDDWAKQLDARIGWSADALLPLGQGVGLAAGYRQRYGSVARLLLALRRAQQQIEQAVALQPLAAGSALAQSHGTQYPLAQGPMTRVSDSPAFAAEVAAGGALPFLALALMRGPQVREMLEDTRKRVGERPWGVGMLGFIPQALRDEQTAEILACKPSYALIAGGRPDQAAEFERAGIPTYIHAPAPALLGLYLEQGARRFVFEGRECGGHVGPIASFPLWEQMIDVLLTQVPNGADKDIHVLFAGGIHDALSAAMVSAMTAPLAARGMKVGALMGTAYLFTREIVSSGAIVPGFQEAALDCTQTLNLESGPGHASRCVDTQFARDFYDTRRQLIRDGRSVEDIRDALEDLNLGRLRIASKGLDRDSSGKVVVVDEQRQRDDGMFMIGQVATLRSEVVSIAELHESVCAGATALLQQAITAREPLPAAKPSDVAIVGIGVTLPRADNADDYWELILKQISVIREAPKARWDSELVYDADPKARDKVYSKWGGFLDEIAFDPLKFGIPPKSMKSIDPLQLLTLETAARTLADAGYSDTAFDRERAAVILGAGGGAGDLGQQYAMRAELPRFVENLSPEVFDRLPEWTEESFAGTLLNVAAGRIANRLDFGGVNFTIDAACGSSLAAISLAVNELETGRSDFVLAGGFDTTQSAFAFTAFAKTQALSPTGRARTFDQNADGIAISEGVAMVALKRLKDAERDGDRIYAVIKATAGSSDGKALGLTAPRTEGQVRALHRAYAKAGFSPATLDLVEAHGTGTPVGDRTEAQTVARALLDSGAAPRTAAIGSVKTLLGHTKAAAGAAGLIKVALSLHHRVLPGHAGVDKPIDVISDPTAPIYLLKEPRPWLAPKDHPRRGAASAFGFGGTNFHAVLEEYRGQRATPGSRRWPVELFLFRGNDAAAVAETLQRTHDALDERSRLQPGELAQALAREADQKRGQPIAVAIVASDFASLKKDLATAIDHLRDGSARPLPPQIRISRTVPATAPTLAFLFPGQGAQNVNMGRDAALYLDEVRDALEFAEATLAGQLPERLSTRMYPPAAFDATNEDLQARAINDTRYAQPAIGTLSLGYLRFVERLGISAVAAAGHSYGEYSALLAAGVLEPADFLRLSAERGRAMAQASAVSAPGGMVAVQAERAQVQAHIADLPGVVIANHNAPQQSVISGPKAALDIAIQRLDAAGLRAVALPVSGAFHTELVAPAKAALSQAIHATHFQAAKLTVYSNSNAQPYPQDAAAMREQLDQHLLSSVEFVAEIEAMYAAGVRVFLELGPRGICTGLTRQILAGRDAQAITLDMGAQGLRGLLLGLAELFVNGVAFDASALYANRDLPALDLAKLRERAAAPVLPKHVWMLSGGCARPQDDSEQRTGKLPALTRASAEAARSATEAKLEAAIRARLPASASSAAPAASALSNEALIAYQQTMRQFLELQERVVQQYLGGGPLPTAALPSLSMPTMPLVATAPVVVPVAAPTPVAAAPVASAPMATDYKALLLGIVAERTGYPTDMLSLDADLEADLGIDSIKRVEIVGALRKALPETQAGAIQQNMERYTKARSLTAILAALDALAPTQPQTVRTEAVEALQQTTASVQVDHKTLLLGIVAERTGYPTDMLSLDADLEADLGIDSIKRVEIVGALRKALPDAQAGAIQQKMERYTKARSLAAILAALDALAPAQQSSARAEPVEAPQPTVADVKLDYKTLLLNIVAERTGYPTDMLSLDADLEADLGIDSIKRVEIVGALRKALPDAQAGAIQQNMERYTKARSLAAILAALDALASASAPTVRTETVEAPQPKPEAVAIATTPRYVIKSRPAPLATQKVSLSGLAVLLGEDDAIATATARALRERGLQPVLVGSDDASKLRSQIEQARTEHGPVRALLNLHGLRMQPVEDLQGWQQAWRRDLLGLFHAIQTTLPDLATARVIAASRNGGTFGRDAVGEGLPISGGANGILNCLRIEVPGCVARAVDFDGHSDTEVVRLLVDELFADDRETEAGYIGLERYGAATLEQALSESPFASHLTPQPDWVLLATGGARGITAQIIERMARPGMRLVLLGRTAEPADEDAATRQLTTTDALRKGLLAQCLARGERPRPVDIDRAVGRIQVDRELRANLQRLRDLGAVVDYRACDVRDEAAFGALIDEIYASHGRIDAVIHGAGVIEDKLLADKAADSFERVLGTKLDPAFVLARRLKPDALKLIAFFTSVAGRYGNRGQSDYAAANETLNRLAWDLHRRWTQTRVMAVNWGPWDGGMASDAIKRQLRERGMEPIPVPSGCQFFLDELANGPRHDVELVAGVGPWGALAVQTPLPATVAPAVSQRPAFARKPLRIGVGGAVTLDHKLTVAGDPWLRDHIVDGQPVVPLAVALETMAQFVALGWPEWSVAEVRDLRMHAPLVVDPETGVDIQLRAKAATHSEPGSQCITVQFGSPKTSNSRGEEPWFRATLVLMQTLPAAVPAQLARLNELDPMSHDEAYAQHLCRGLRLRSVRDIGALAANGAVANVQASSPDDFIAGSSTPWLFDPALLDALSQVAFVWAQRHQGKGVQPLRIGRVRRFGTAPASGTLKLVQHFVAGDKDRLGAVAEFFDADGALRYVVEDIESTISTSLNRLAPSSPDYIDPAVGGKR